MNNQEPNFNFFPIDPAYGGEKSLVGIVGHGFVGKAVERSFISEVDRFIVDPIYKTNIDQLVEKEPTLAFVCTPTPSDSSGRIDAAVTVDAVLKLIRLTKSAVVLKSTVTPEVLDKICRTIHSESTEESDAMSRFLYVPEFLTEGNADHDYCNPKYMVVGGSSSSCGAFLEFIHYHTMVVLPKNQEDDGGIHQVSHIEASLIKYAINAFLATKLTFFNNLYDLCEHHKDKGVSPSNVAKCVVAEPRIGNTHWRVPGFDGKKGFGGACFPKDTSALVAATDKMPLLESVIEINNKIRSEHDLNSREKAQNITFSDHVIDEGEE